MQKNRDPGERLLNRQNATDSIPVEPPPSAVRLGLGSRLSLEARDRLLGFGLISPAALFFLVLIAYPMLQTIFLSLHKVNTMSLRREFVGFGNYLYMLSEPDFWSSFKTTLIWTVSVLVAQVVLGVGMALLLHGNIIFRSVARGLVLFPYLLPTVVAVLVWQWLFNDLYGFLNYFFVNIGLFERPIAWLSQMPNAMISLVIVGTWKFFPFVVIAVLARLQTIPEPLYEAAKIDGASAWDRLWDITLPQLRGVLIMVILLRSIWDFKDFDVPYLLTGGGPQIGTETLPLLVYKQAFPLLNIGRGATVAVLMLIFMMSFFWLYFRAYRREEEAGR